MRPSRQSSARSSAPGLVIIGTRSPPERAPPPGGTRMVTYCCHGCAPAPHSPRLRLTCRFNVDGTHIRKIKNCRLGPPLAMVADQGRVYLIEDRDEAIAHGLPENCEEHEWAGRRLFVIDIETGSVLQKVRLEGALALSGVAVHGEQVFLCVPRRSPIQVLTRLNVA